MHSNVPLSGEGEAGGVFSGDDGVFSGDDGVLHTFPYVYFPTRNDFQMTVITLKWYKPYTW